jgi:hypothetical protein
MNSSYRVRTQVGVDKSVQVDLQQDFEVLEILSLKIYQRDVYTRVCSDYGVICGRVFANNGFGIPNVKISLFIPLSDEDAQNPEITSIYPYENISDLDVNGYRYNLLPKEQSHSGHVPTGSFPTREEILKEKSYYEVYDKYYKFTVKTNDSGDYMIFGVPVGSFTIFLDLDLSDIGQFSLNPQDLIRIGLATEGQVSGVKFNDSTNLNSLPQIISLTKQVEVLPLWGNEEICQPSITRTDFDLTAEANIDLTPTAVFMGSIMSTIDEAKIDNNCKIDKKVGDFCSLVTGPGQILAIRQTINYDTDVNSVTFGYPQLEKYNLQNDGYLIDENGAWLIEVPMNLDYIYTNEFGEQVISTDPTIGVPTKGKYRFKIKWNQSPSLSEQTRRAYFLVPNVKEWGWGEPGNTYNDDENPAFYPEYSTNDNYLRYQQSYAFSLDWYDYGDPTTSEGLEMIQDAINCEDRFYLFEFKKVYTVSQLMDKYKNGNKLRFIGIKNILNDDCSAENNKYPVNDAYRGSNIMFLLFRYILSVMKLLLFPLVVVMHAISLVLYIVNFILQIIVWLIYAPIYYFIAAVVAVVNFLAPGAPLNNPLKKTPAELSRIIWDKLRIKKIPLPLLLQSENECTFCECKEGENSQEYTNSAAGALLSELGNSCHFPLNDGGAVTPTLDIPGEQQQNFPQVIAGLPNSGGNCSARIPTSAYNSPWATGGLTYDDEREFLFSNSLTFAERINLSNTKQKYFRESTAIRTYVEPDLNGNQFHTDNVLVTLIQGCDDIYQPGALITFQDPSLSTDPNFELGINETADGLYQISGTSTSATSITVSYCTLDNNTLTGTKVYNLPLKDSEEYLTFARYRFDMEYFQVVTAITYSQFISLGNGSASDLSSHGTFYHRIFKTPMSVMFAKDTAGNQSQFEAEFKGTVFCNESSFSELANSKIVIMVRGVDPYSPKYKIKYDISRILNRGYGQVVVGGGEDVMFKLNIPVQPGGTSTGNKKRSVRHNQIVNNNSADQFGGRMFFPSWFFQPGTEFQPFQTELTKYYGSMDASLINAFNVIPWETSSTNLNSLQVGQNSEGYLLVKMKGQTLQCEEDMQASTGYGCNAFTAHYEWEGDDKWGFPPQPNDNALVNGVGENGGSTWGGSAYMLHYADNGLLGDSVDGCSFMYMHFGGDNNEWKKSRSVYYSPSYLNGTPPGTYGNFGKTLIDNPTNIVFRSDRLPTSTTTTTAQRNHFLFFQNRNFSAFRISDTGEVYASSSSVDGIELENALFSDGSTLGALNDQVVASFSECASAVPLKCYNIDNDGVVIIDDFPDCTTGPLGIPYFQNGKGCYSLVTIPIIGIPWDFFRINEWYKRTLTSLFLCMEGIQYHFFNNWVSGNLFMPTFYSITELNNDGFPVRRYCEDIIVFHEDSKNYYYRSSPYRYGYGFIGGRTRQRNEIAGLNNYVRGNYRNLKTPTTIINLGPITSYTQELVQGVGYSGYIANTLTPSSFRDITDIVNFFVASRQIETAYEQAVNTFVAISLAIVNPGILLVVGGGDPTKNFFGDRNSREPEKVNADLAQMISINSEYGVKPFNPAGYPSANSIRIIPIYNLFDINVLLTALASGGVAALLTPAKFTIGIFFNSDNSKRDAITPKRIVWNQNAQLPFQPNDVTLYTQPSQSVPFYQWQNDYMTRAEFLELPLGINIPYPLLGREVIFGSHKNDWYTEPINSNTTTFFQRNIQYLDRTENTSRYFMAESNQAKYMKGFIYNVDSDGNLREDLGNITEDKYTVGSPYHFYFGLKRGRTAVDLFYIKYVDSEIVIE